MKDDHFIFSPVIQVTWYHTTSLCLAPNHFRLEMYLLVFPFSCLGSEKELSTHDESYFSSSLYCATSILLIFIIYYTYVKGKFFSIISIKDKVWGYESCKEINHD